MYKKIKNKRLRNIVIILQSLAESCIIVGSVFIIISLIYIASIFSSEKFSSVNSVITKNNDASLLSTFILVDTLEHIPDKHLEMIKDAGYTIEISDKKLIEAYRTSFDETKRDVEDRVGGITVHDKKKVYIRDDYKNLEFSVLHEIGHVLSKVNNDLKSEAEFIDCYNLEKEKMREYGQRNCSEYFAEVYMLNTIRHIRFEFTKDDFPRSSEFIRRNLW